LGGELFYFPYDGKLIGSFNPDTTRKFSIFLRNSLDSKNNIEVTNNAGWQSGSVFNRLSAGYGSNADGFYIETIGNFGNETTPAWIAVNYYITY